MGCHSENRISNSESCSENIPELTPRAPRMAFSLREHFSCSWGGAQASELCSLPQDESDALSFRGQLTCTNKRAQADEQKIARNGVCLAPPAMHLLCKCSMLVRNELSHLRGPRKNGIFAPSLEFLVHCRAFLRFLWSSLFIVERAKKLQKLIGSALPHLIIRCRFDSGSIVIAQKAGKMLKMAFQLCTFVGAHQGLMMRRPPIHRAFLLWSALPPCL